MKQWSIKIFMENEIKSSKKQLMILMSELILIIVLAAVFTVAFIILGEWNWVFSIIIFTFITVILLGIYNWYDTLNYVKRAEKFKAYIDEVYKKKNAGSN